MVIPQSTRAATTRDKPSASTARPPGRNQPCHCGSRRKYKRCCLQQDLRARRTEHGLSLPPWLIDSERKLHGFLKYSTNVFNTPSLLRRFTDTRRRGGTFTYSTFEVVNSIFHAGLLRRPSINAIEGDLKKADIQKLLGLKVQPDVKAFSAEVIGNVLDKLDLKGPRSAIEDVLWTAERNKTFLEGSFGTLRCVAIDGWEPFCSYDRCCPDCLTREVSVKNSKTGEIEKKTQYYHRYVVAMLVGPVLDVVLDIEPVLNADKRDDLGEHEDPRHEGELTAARRLIGRLHQTYGSFIDALVLDALYANGPIMTKLDQCKYGGVIVLKKDNNEPLKEALAFWDRQQPCECVHDADKKEDIEFWDVDDIDTLETYAGKVRVIRAVINKKKKGSGSTWCFALVGARARKLGRKTALKIIRSRWHLENTGFGQWVKYWNLGRVYRHTANAIMAILLLWILVFNMLQLYVYRRLKRERNPKDPCDTIISIVAEMFRDVGSIIEPIPWEVLADAGPTG
jgi:hypothetical protein